MLNNYEATVTALCVYVLANAPAGAGRDLGDLSHRLTTGNTPDYLHFEFRPSQDVGCTLYVRVESPDGKYDRSRVIDAEGNRWYAYVVKCEVSWSSWGSADVATCQRRLACMTEVTRFACDLERAFSETFHRLDATAAEIAAQNASFAKQNAEAEIKRQVLANAKGMKVGQSKSFCLPPTFDLTGVDKVQVERSEGGRKFKYEADLGFGYHAGEAGLVYFMRLEA